MFDDNLVYMFCGVCQCYDLLFLGLLGMGDHMLIIVMDM